MTFEEVLVELKALANPNEKDLEGMKRYGINTENTLCISMPKLDELTKKIKKAYSSSEAKRNRKAVDSNSSRLRSNNIESLHQLALELWKTGIREARILAGRIDVPELVTLDQMESWVKDFNSWDVCDNTIMKDFSYSKLGWEKAIPWSKSDKEFIKRAGFVLMAMLAMHDKTAKDDDFYPFLKRIKEEASDERNFVKKAVNWALRTIGKARTKNLYNLALETANDILEQAEKTSFYSSSGAVAESRSSRLPAQMVGTGGRSNSTSLATARWIAKDAIRELTTSKYILKKFGEG